MSDQIDTYATPYGTVSVIGGVRRTHYNGRHCYAVVTTGDHDAFFSPQDYELYPELYPEILHQEDRADGKRETWYVPRDDTFEQYANELERLGAWDEEEGAAL